MRKQNARTARVRALARSPVGAHDESFLLS